MGLAASQGRMLCLTARMNDLIYEGQQISQQRMALADKQIAISQKYTDAMNNKIMMANTPDGNSQVLSFAVLTSQDPFTGLGMRIVDLNGNVVIPKNVAFIDVEDKDGNKETYNFSNSSDFIGKYMSGLSGDELDKVTQMNMSQLLDYYNKNYASGNEYPKLTYNDQYSYLKGDGERFLFDENISDNAYLQQMLESGAYVLEKLNEEKVWDSKYWTGSSAISEVLDTSDDAAAEAEYENAMLETQKKDKLLELRLEQVQTEEKAVQTDLESIKEVIKNNIQGSFTTFSTSG